MVLSWFVYVHTMMVPGCVDRIGRFKGTDYIYFYVMGSLISEAGRMRCMTPTRTWPRAVAGSIRSSTCMRPVRPAGSRLNSLRCRG